MLQAECFYDLGVPDSDEEIELGGYASDVSGVSSFGGSTMSGGTDADVAGTAQAADAASDTSPAGRPAKAAREDTAPKVRLRTGTLGWMGLWARARKYSACLLPQRLAATAPLLCVDAGVPFTGSVAFPAGACACGAPGSDGSRGRAPGACCCC